jgi:tetratricopeptide (TPR) repeat protein
MQEKLATDFPKVVDHQFNLGATLNRLAKLLGARGEPAQARPLLERAIRYQQAALSANPRNPLFGQRLADSYKTLAQMLIQLAEHAAAAKVAAELPRVWPGRAQDAYDAAGLIARCVPLAQQDESLPEAKRHEVARAYGDQALAFLQEALQKGYNDIAHLKKDPNLDPLRSRADFQQLLAGLQGKVP